MNGSVSNDTTTLTTTMSLTVELTISTQSMNAHAVVPNVPYKTIALSANNAYSIRLAPPSSELSYPPFGTSIKGKGLSNNSGYGFIVGIYDKTADKIYPDTQCGNPNYACYADDTLATGPSTNICVVIANPTYNNVILNVVVSFAKESPFITNDVNSNADFFNFGVTDIPANETITINYKDYVTTAQLSKRYYKN
nr:6066_t:CDS:2 [Entrophospora candida]